VWIQPARPPQASGGTLTRQYVRSACHFAELISEVILTSHVDTMAALLAWESAEEDYVDRGFRSIPLSEFIDHVSWATALRNVGVKRSKGEGPMLHARYYRTYVLKKKGLQDLHTLLAYEGLLDYEPSRRVRRLQS
jgi:hypothetical protein